jgi:antitoxin (DNA-binding transcriptional repressor) of toxin-antitoxin stability system
VHIVKAERIRRLLRDIVHPDHDQHAPGLDGGPDPLGEHVPGLDGVVVDEHFDSEPPRQRLPSVRAESISRQQTKMSVRTPTSGLVGVTARAWRRRLLLNLREAKLQLSARVEEAASGTEIVIAKAGVPRARLVPLAPTTNRRPGGSRGRIRIAADFDAPLPEALLAAFTGRKR